MNKKFHVQEVNAGESERLNGRKRVTVGAGGGEVYSGITTPNVSTIPPLIESTRKRSVVNHEIEILIKLNQELNDSIEAQSRQHSYDRGLLLQQIGEFILID